MLSSRHRIGATTVLLLAAAGLVAAAPVAAAQGNLGLYGDQGKGTDAHSHKARTVHPGHNTPPSGPPATPPQPPLPSYSATQKYVVWLHKHCQPGANGLVCNGHYHPGNHIPGSATPGATIREFGPSTNPGTECAETWNADYDGHTFPMSGNTCAGVVTSPWIEAECIGASPTSGTVNMDLQLFGQVPNGPYVAKGPYTGAFTIPSCSPAAQENPTSIHWQPQGPHYPQDTVNGQGIGVKWRLVPVVTPAGVDVPIAPTLGPTIEWDGFTSTPTVTNYAKNQILGPNTQAAIGHPLPQWQLRTGGPDETVSASNSGHSAPVLRGYFYVRTFKHKPMLVKVTGQYTAFWGHWYFRVSASASAQQGSVPYITGYNSGCETVKLAHHKTEQQCWKTPIWGTYYFPTDITVSPSTTGIVPRGDETANFPVSVTIPVRAYRAAITGSENF